MRVSTGGCSLSPRSLYCINLDDGDTCTETTFHVQGFLDKFCLAAAEMAPFTPPGPFNPVTAQTANERFTPVFRRPSRFRAWWDEWYQSQCSSISLFLKEGRTRTRTSQYMINISWLSGRVLSRTCYSSVKHRRHTELMDLECGMF